MPGISALGDTVLPPSASIFFRDSSIESTWMTILGVGVSVVRARRPPLIAPGSVGACVFSSMGVVSTRV